MNKQVARYGLYFVVLSVFFEISFPEKFFGNIYVLVSYLVICLVFIYLLFFWKRGKKVEE